ncbi:MAG: LAGLIDADG family homing endonuclease [Nitrosopumilaceae archaeon]
MTADNQQERLDARWVSGFVDGEGCFHVSINKSQKMSIGWQVLPEFRVVQHERDESVLKELQQFFGAGKVVTNHGSRKELRIRKLDDLKKIVLFFKQNKLRTGKKKNLEIFGEILELMDNKKHLTVEGLTKIANLCWSMNRKIKPRFLESSETLCQRSF